MKDLEELNTFLEQRCREDLQRRIRGHVQTKEQLLREEQMCLLPLPFTAFEACRTQPGRVNSELLVRFDDNDYSVPMEYAYQDVVVKGDTDQVKICRFQEVIAVHRRCWGRQQQIFDPLHYLPLLERKPHAPAFARPLAGWTLPGCFEVLQRRIHSKDGIEQFLAGGRPWRQTAFPLGRTEHLRLVQIAQADVRQYGTLLGCGGVR